VQLPDEAQSEVYKFSEVLEKNGATEGALLVQAHAVTVRQNYSKNRQVSLFTNVFGFNFAGFSLQRVIPDSAITTANMAFTDATNKKIEEMSSDFTTSLSENDFESARKLFDPSMVANDIASFSSTTQVIATKATSYGYLYEKPLMSISTEQLFNGNQKSIYNTVYLIVTRFSGRHVGIEKEVPVDLSYSFRNGKLVLTHSGIIISYLPDAVTENGNSSLGSYGYDTFCKVPTLEVLFTADRGCTDQEFSTENVYTDSTGRSMGSFYKEDFKAR
jgi:hypothetical protein